jgi:hypothetical protein
LNDARCQWKATKNAAGMPYREDFGMNVTPGRPAKWASHVNELASYTSAVAPAFAAIDQRVRIPAIPARLDFQIRTVWAAGPAACLNVQRRPQDIAR